MNYPDKHHPVFFLVDALNAAGAQAEFARDARTENCWGAIVNGRVVVWLIDNRHEHERVTEDPAAADTMKRGAVVMCAQKPDAERIGAKWLPLAVTPGYRPPATPIEKLYDVGFVGFIRDEGRMRVLADVARHFKLHTAQGVFGDDAVSVYWQSRVGLNVPTGYGNADDYDSANMRCFEILATGTPLITPFEPYLIELGLIDMDNCCLYRNPDDLIERIDLLSTSTWDVGYGSKNTSGMGARGAELAQSRHTYAHRAQQVLEWLK